MLTNKYLNLNMGLVKENFAIIKRKDKKLWESRGFKKIRKYPVFHYFPKPTEIIMLGKPLNIEGFQPQRLIGCKITDFCPYLGTYGMGGSGFCGFQIDVNNEKMWLVYCIWAAGEHILLDNRVLECHPKYAKKYDPWISADQYSKSIDSLKTFICGTTIVDVTLTDDSFTMSISDRSGKCHKIHTQNYSDKFPEQGGTGVKRKSYENGSMKDFWLIIYDGTQLSV